MIPCLKENENFITENNEKAELLNDLYAKKSGKKKKIHHSLNT